MADYQWHCRSQGLLGVGLSSWTENKAVLCFHLQDWSSRPCPLFTAKCFSVLHVKAQQRNHSFLQSPCHSFAWCGFTYREKFIWLEHFLPMTVALLIRIIYIGIIPLVLVYFKVFLFQYHVIFIEERE